MIIFPPAIIGGLKQEIIFKGTRSGDSAGSHTFNGVDFGDVRTSRLVVACYARVRPDAVLEIDGGGTVYGASGDNLNWVVASPSGATGTIFVDHDTSFRAVIAYWVLYGMRAAALDFDLSEDLSSPFTNDASVSLVNRGAWLAMSYSADAHSLSGIGNVSNHSLNSGSDRISVGRALTSAAGTGTVSTTVSNRISALSFNPYP